MLNDCGFSTVKQEKEEKRQYLIKQTSASAVEGYLEGLEITL